MQLTLSAEGLAAANYANTHGLTITIDKFRVYRSNVAEASLPYVPTGAETAATLAGWTQLPNTSTVFTAVEEFEALSPDTVQFSCYLDNTVGDFDFDVLAVFLADDTFFGLTTWDTLVHKFQSGALSPNGVRTHLAILFSNASAIVNIDIDNSKWSFDYIPEVNDAGEIPVAATAPHRIYRVTRAQTVADSGVRSFLVQSGKSFFDPKAYQKNEWIPSDHRLVFGESDLLVVADHPTDTNYQNTLGHVVVSIPETNTFRLEQILRNGYLNMLLSFFEPADTVNQGVLRHMFSILHTYDAGALWIRFWVNYALVAPAVVGQRVKLYTSQMDFAVPLPNAENLALRSLAAPDTANGFGFEWAEGAIVPIPAGGVDEVLVPNDPLDGGLHWTSAPRVTSARASALFTPTGVFDKLLTMTTNVGRDGDGRPNNPVAALDYLVWRDAFQKTESVVTHLLMNGAGWSRMGAYMMTAAHSGVLPYNFPDSAAFYRFRTQSTSFRLRFTCGNFVYGAGVHKMLFYIFDQADGFPASSGNTPRFTDLTVWYTGNYKAKLDVSGGAALDGYYPFKDMSGATLFNAYVKTVNIGLGCEVQVTVTDDGGSLLYFDTTRLRAGAVFKGADNLGGGSDYDSYSVMHLDFQLFETAVSDNPQSDPNLW